MVLINSFSLSRRSPRSINHLSGIPAMPRFSNFSELFVSSRQNVPKPVQLIVFNFARGKPMPSETPARSPARLARDCQQEERQEEFACPPRSESGNRHFGHVPPASASMPSLLLCYHQNGMYDPSHSQTNGRWRKTYLEWGGQGFRHRCRR